MPALLKRLLYSLVLLAACRVQQVPAPPPAAALLVPAAQPWATTIADRLYERQLLNVVGRDTLRRRIAANRLYVSYEVPGSSRQFADQQVDAATVLNFCEQAFQAEVMYRTAGGRGDSLISDLYIAGQAPDSAAIRTAQQRFAKMLQAVQGDTAALFRQLASPGQLLEEKIPPEDSVLNTGWTIFPPLGTSSSLPHYIADSRSVFGKTRTRTARDLYELGLVTEPQYAVLRRESVGGELTTEIAVCQRAAQLALEVATYSTRRVAFDSLLTKLTQIGVLSSAGRQRALADSQVVQQLELFALLPYCEHTKVVVLAALPHDPRQSYPQLLAEVATIWPAFRYTAARATLVERQELEHHYVSQEITLAFTANGRRYASTFTQGYRTDETPRPGAIDIQEEFAVLLNQWFRDQDGAERFYLAYTPDQQSVYGQKQLGFSVFIPTQRAAWGPVSYFLSDVPADNKFTSAYIERALALYQRLGLLARLSAAELAAGHRKALRGQVDSYAGLLACFPRTIASTGGEDAEEPQAYAKALRQVAATTRGAFRPTRIRDTFSGHQARKQKSALSFVSGGRQYRATLVSDLGWMDFGFVKLLERAVRETTPGQLYYLGGNEMGEYIFLTTAQAVALRKGQPDFFKASNEEKNAEK